MPSKKEKLAKIAAEMQAIKHREDKDIEQDGIDATQLLIQAVELHNCEEAKTIVARYMDIDIYFA